MAKTIDITKYFTRDNEQNGIWKELMLNGDMSGIEACIYGVNSNAFIMAREQFKKESAEIAAIKDVNLRNEKSEVAFAKFVSKIVKDFRNKETQESLGDKGKPMTDDELFNVMFNSPIIARAVMDISGETELFLEN